MKQISENSNQESKLNKIDPKTFRETQQDPEPKEKFSDGSELSGSRLSFIKLYKKVNTN